MTYDPQKGPDPDDWLELTESERIALVTEHHESSTEPHPDAQEPRLHVWIHVIVENQLALGDPPATAAALARLQRQGLDRHEALHAVGFVLAGQMWRANRDGKEFNDKRYARDLNRLTVKRWRRMA